MQVRYTQFSKPKVTGTGPQKMESPSFFVSGHCGMTLNMRSAVFYDTELLSLVQPSRTIAVIEDSSAFNLKQIAQIYYTGTGTLCIEAHIVSLYFVKLWLFRFCASGCGTETAGVHTNFPYCKSEKMQ